MTNRAFLFRFGVVVFSAFLCLLGNTYDSFARIIFSTEFVSEQVNNAFVIDNRNDTTGNISLQFGNTLGKAITYDVSQHWFSLNANLNIQGNQLLNARLENSASDPLACITTIAGRTYFNTTTQRLRYCDGNAWVEVGEAGASGSGTNNGPIPAIQVRRETNLASFPINEWTKVPFTATDLANSTQTLELQTSDTSRVQIKKSGLYQIFYRVNHNAATTTHRLQSRIVRNSTVVPGSIVDTRNYQNEYTPNNATVVTQLTAGDYVSLEVFRNTDNGLTDHTVLVITKLESGGSEGPAGPQGIAGPQGPAGSTGPSGINALISQTPADTQLCPQGGYVFSTGGDTNSNNILDPEEVTNTATICNGVSVTNTLDGACVLTLTASYSRSAQYALSLSNMTNYIGNVLQVDWLYGNRINTISNSNGGSSSWINPVYMLAISGTGQNLILYVNYSGTPPANEIPTITSAQIKKQGKILHCNLQ